jgi:hypothetical protein
MSLPFKTIPNLYDRDFAAWAERQAFLLKQRRYEELDLINLVDEVEDLSRRERQALVSNLIVVLLHLLKWQYQPEMRSGSWRGSIVEHRRRCQQALKDSPSLKPYLEEIFVQCYRDAVEQASAETELPVDTFPVECPFLLAEVLQSGFLPKDESEEE